MRVAAVSAGAVPNPTTGGGALTQWTVIRWLVERGHDVTVCHLSGDAFVDPSGVARAERVRALERLGARVELVEPAERRLVLVSGLRIWLVMK